MRQLAGLACVFCEKPIGSMMDGRFCTSCGCPVHTHCTRPAENAERFPGCSVCGATVEHVQREQGLHADDERERIEAGHSASEWIVLLSLSKKFRNPLTMFLREDRGPLEWQSGKIRILGRRLHEFSRVKACSLVGQPIPWMAVILSNAIILGMTLTGGTKELTPANPLTWMILTVLNLFLVAATVSTKWIRVVFRDESSPETDVYLLPVTVSGLRRFDGASERLLTILLNEVVVQRD